jgi:hypothetical protein
LATVSIRIVADCVALSCQITEMLKRAKTARKPTSGYYFYTLLALVIHLIIQILHLYQSRNQSM